MRHSRACHAAGMDAVIGRELDVEDLYTTPDDGSRYEILDGALVMTPAPNIGHQRAVSRLLRILDDAIADRHLEVLPAPTAWRIGPGQVPEPDLMVVTPEDPAARAVRQPPLLVVEVVSPSGRWRDLFQKRHVYAEGGAAWYWIVDPTVPSLTVLRLAGEAYEDAGHVEGHDAYDAREPFAVHVVPADLTR